MKRISIMATIVVVIAISGCAVSTSDRSNPYGHIYGVVEVPEGLPVPTLEIEMIPDASVGWNLHLITENLTFAPESVGTEHYPGEGHAHLHIDGQLYSRLYSTWYHLIHLTPGPHQITVTLNTNDHNAYAINGEIISATKVIVVEQKTQSSGYGNEKNSSSGYGE